MNYKDAGVDVERGYKSVELIKKHTKKTLSKNVLFDLGSFGGFYSIENEGVQNPVLVAGTDGVGTKLKYAFLLDKHDTIGIDAVAMCVNDVVCQGAKPLFFLDYFATAKIEPEKVEQVVKGMSDGCVLSGCSLIGGETAEMPGFYGGGEYDVAGFCVGIADRTKIINGSDIAEGDVLIGLASSGLHSNGFSLVRKIFGEDKNVLNQFEPALNNVLGQELLTPTRIYVKTILELIKKHTIKGIAHITGGGFIENIPRIFPAGIGGRIDLSAIPQLPVYKLIRQKSGLSDKELYNTFNMGIGMVLCVDKAIASKVVADANALGEKAYIIGETIKGEGIQF